MPDHLGADQRKVRKEDDKDEKPIQGIVMVALALKYYFCSYQSLFMICHSSCGGT